MKILYHHRTQALDGQRVHIREIQDALRAAGHEVREVAPVAADEVAGGSCRPTWRRRLGSLARMAPKGAYEAIELAYNLVGYVELSRAIRRDRPDFLYERYAINTVAGAWASRRFGIPLLLEVNSPLADEKRRLGKLVFYRLARRLEGYALRHATRVLAVTGVLRRMLVDGATGVDEGRVLVIQNGVRPEAFRLPAAVREARRRELGLEGRVVVGAVGFFREWHGIELLLRCLHRDPALRGRSRLLLVGEGPAVPGLRAAAERLGLAGDVVFAGAVPHDEVPSFVAAMDVVLIPRAVEYASPLKLFEYMAAGKAILAPRQENLMEVLTDGVDALCFRPEDGDDLESALGRLVGDEALRDRLGPEARRTIHRRGLTWDENAARIVRAFQGCEPCREAGVAAEGLA